MCCYRSVLGESPRRCGVPRGDTRRPSSCERETIQGRRSTKSLQGKASRESPHGLADHGDFEGPRVEPLRAGALSPAIVPSCEPRRRVRLPQEAMSEGAR